MVGNLARALNLPEENADIVAQDINVEIFEPLEKLIGEKADLQTVTPEFNALAIKIKEAIRKGSSKTIREELKSILETSASIKS